MKTAKSGEKRELSGVENDESPSKKTKINKNKIQEEYENILQEKLAMQYPPDFYLFYEFIQEKSNKSCLSLVDLHLTGPYDILCGNISKETTLSITELSMHGRHFYDIPEVQTILYSNHKSGFHIGYFRDDSKELPSLLVSNKSNENGEFSACGDNLFASVYIFCKSLLKSTKDAENLKKIKKFILDIEKKSKDLGYSLDATSPSVKKRQKSINSKTFNKIGIKVPMDKTGVGYRELPSTDRELKQILTKIAKADTEEKKNNAFDELDEIITLVQFANDECDYGMGLELGLNLFAFGDASIRGPLLHLLPLAYQLLRRNLYSDIVKHHMENRKKDGFIDRIQK